MEICEANSDFIIQLRYQLLSWTEIAEIIGVSKSTMYSWVKVLKETSVRGDTVNLDMDQLPVEGQDLQLELPPFGTRHVDHAQVSKMRMYGTKWKDIAETLGITTSALKHWRERVAFVDTCISNHAVTDEMLDRCIAEVAFGNPQRGIRFTRALLLSHGIRVHRDRVCEALHAYDPQASEDRTCRKLKRRVYFSPSPHFVWHCDGNHKLREFRLCVHGGIDGFSSAITFLECTDNNRATTVLNLFSRAVARYGFPLHIRTDHGGENVLMADSMTLARGPQSVLMGASTRNQRIERFWKDAYEQVIGNVCSIFARLKALGVDFDRRDHVYCVHILTIPLINVRLRDFIEIWNWHPLERLRCRSPNIMLTMYQHLNPPPVELSDEDHLLLETIVAQHDDDYYERLIVEPIGCDLTETQHARFVALVRPLPIQRFHLEYVEDFLLPAFLETLASYLYVKNTF